MHINTQFLYRDSIPISSSSQKYKKSKNWANHFASPCRTHATARGS